MAEKWRDDGLDPNGAATINAVSIKAEDLVERNGILRLCIKHVVGFYGNGFMANLSCGINSDVIYGTNDHSYKLALRLGRIMLDRETKKLKEELGKIKDEK